MRSTLDVDIVADMHQEHIQPLVEALSKDFYYETALKVDTFICKSRPFDQMQLERRKASVIATDPERSIYITSPEDVILSKLEWYRLGGEVSDRQWRDILGVLKTRAGELNLDYLRTLAMELKVEDLLERALGEV